MPDYLLPEETPTRDDINATSGPVMLEFGTGWCGYCRALTPVVNRLLAPHPDVQHVKVEDGSGRPLGRSFGVTLWPTFVFLKNGQVIQQLSRPEQDEIADALRELTIA